MEWSLIEYNFFSGKENMDIDLKLVKNCQDRQAILRFYGWNPFCISLGANQSFADIDHQSAIRDSIEIVKRPTGGRAILHANELTYSVIMPSNEISGRLIYEKISRAIVLGLKNFDKRLGEVELESVDPHFPQLLDMSSGALCFASTAKSEIKFKGKKLVGSAQRKIGSKILQHGSILIDEFHKNLISYLNVDSRKKSRLKKEMDEKTTEIETILNQEVNILQLQDNIISGFEEHFGASFFAEKIETF